MINDKLPFLQDNLLQANINICICQC